MLQGECAMGILDFLKKPKVQETFTETTFECRRGGLTIRSMEYRPGVENHVLHGG